MGTNGLFSGFWQGNPIAGMAFLLAIVLILPIVFVVLSPKLGIPILQDIRLPRIIYFIALSGLGAALFLRHPVHFPFLFQPELWLKGALWTVSLIYAAIFAIVTNNLADIQADRISNPNRPLITGAVKRGPYLFAGICSLMIALIVAFGSSVYAGFGITGISLGYFLYSCPPVRLKRIPILSKLIIGLNSLAVTMTGWVLVGGTWNTFPLAWIIFILGPLSLTANFIDLKDTEGDRAAGIATLPVLLGESIARHLIAAATILTYGMAGLLLNVWFVYPLGAICLMLQLFFLYRKPYAEKWVFLMLILALFGLDFFLFFP